MSMGIDLDMGQVVTTFDERAAAALERIATALEQMVLNEMGTAKAAQVGFLTGEPPLPTPPPDLPRPQLPPADPSLIGTEYGPVRTVALPPVQPFQFTGPSAF